MESLGRGTRNLGDGSLRHLLARLGFDQRGVAAELGRHLQQLFLYQRIGDAVSHAAGAVSLKAIMVNFEHCHSPSALPLKSPCGFRWRSGCGESRAAASTRTSGTTW